MNSSKELKIYGKPETWSKHRIVCLHALADQSSLIEELGMKPDDCVLCDVYWDFKGYLFFISFNKSNLPGIDLQLKSDLEHPYSFVIKTSKGPLTKNMIEKGIDYLKGWVETQNLDVYHEVNSSVCILKNDLFLE